MRIDPDGPPDGEEPKVDALVVGAGPAGLMAADMISSAGFSVLVADQKPSFGRKFLMAGKSGLNLTKADPPDLFVTRYDTEWIAPMLRAFGPAEVQVWAEGLGQRLFTGSTGRVFPHVMKASPLLRAWLARLDAQSVQMRRRWCFAGWDVDRARFATPDGPRLQPANVTILALGGGSWARLGSDGLWAGMPELSGGCAPFQPSNTGLSVRWSDHMTVHFGKPLKAVRWRVRAGAVPFDAGTSDIATSRGEAVLSERGLEGGGIYSLIPALRGGAERRLMVDLAPDLSVDALAARLPARVTGLSRLLRNGLRWPPEKVALFHEWSGRQTAPTALSLAQAIKQCPVPHHGPRPLDEAISTAGGLRRDVLTGDLELCNRTGVFACGEMLDWDAPTGGYLLTACLATGRWAGQAAVRRLAGLDAPAR